MNVFKHIFVSPGDVPDAITLYVTWMESEFDAYKLYRWMCPSNYNRFSDLLERDIGRKSSFFSYPLAFDAPVRGVSVGIAPPRLAWKNYNGLATRRWKNFEYIFIRFGATHERDGHTDGHRVTAYTALMHTHRAVKTGNIRETVPHINDSASKKLLWHVHLFFLEFTCMPLGWRQWKLKKKLRKL